MSHIASIYCSRVALRLALIAGAAGLLAGCAGSERMADPFSNPFQTSDAGTDPAPTSSINPSSYHSAAPVTPVQSRPLGAPVAQYSSPATQASRVAAASPPRVSQAVAGWSAAGGTPVSVGPGESASVLANRYGVPVDALVKANGLASAAQVQPGTRIVIPVYNAVGGAAAARVAQAEAAAPAPVRAAESHAQKIKLLKGAPETRLANASEKAQRQTAEKAAAMTHAGKVAAEQESARAAKVAEVPVKTLVAEAPRKVAVVKTEAVAAQPVKTAVLTKQDAARQAKIETPAQETAKAEPEDAAGAPADAAKAGGANPEFRWPARGRIIQAFKLGGNDGINIAVPEGTSVKAAESGVVAYAGNELKGYGNLILIRHPNGFVSAYANNGDIEVKRGETVKRGQVIAKSGQSGNVASPQLHFELRKGATPVDPTLYLAGL
ncbi:Peptidase M23 [Methylocella tundrae]|uniref:Peptidase M23 n=1 Tax=Methylocella tundrae TaxID=227605 RepID=A0A8B6M7S3_METTU|nr:peptidoglycan DD-metalloendopeptidase family protein [Methylocella tundrae]VTZ50350.1 Peptidase M23 [Methylocella tundrae]